MIPDIDSSTIYLTINWLNNIINEKDNEEILLLLFLDRMLKKQIIKEQIKKSLKLDNYNIYTIDEIQDINHLNKNTIIISSISSIDILKDLNKKILICYAKSFINYFNFKLGNIKLSTKNIQEKYKSLDFKLIDSREYDYYQNFLIFRRDPLSLIFNKDGYNKIEVICHIIKCSFILNSELFDEKIVFKFLRDFYNEIKMDLEIFSKEKKLTSRFAIFLYKILTFDFNASDTKIGRYYAKGLKVKSSTYNIPIKIINNYEFIIKKQKVKAYDLNKSTLFSNKK